MRLARSNEDMTEFFIGLLGSFIEFLGFNDDFFSFFLEGEGAKVNRFAFKEILCSFLVLVFCLFLPFIAKVIKWIMSLFTPFVAKLTEQMAGYFSNFDSMMRSLGSVFNYFDRLASRLVNVGPGVLTTIGIFFTFLGITIGLKDFDPSPDKFNENTSKLIEGMKLAFFSSVLAIGASIIFKIIASFIKSSKKEEFQEIKEALSGEGLLEWQKKYEGQIKYLVRAHEKIKESLQKSDKAKKSVVSNTEEIPKHMQSMQKIMSALQEQLDSFAFMKERALDAMPYIQENLHTLTEGMKKNVEESIQVMQEVVAKQQNAVDEVNNAYKTFPSIMEDSADKFRKSMHSNIQNAVHELGEHITAFGKEFGLQLEIAKKHTDELEEMLNSQRQKPKDNL